MVRKTKRFSIPEYREKKEIFTLLGYKEIAYEEKGIRCKVTFELDNTDKNYLKLRQLEREIYRKGPPFFPIILFVVGAFVFLSIFVLILATNLKDGVKFDLNGNAIGLLLPAFSLLLACVIYTYVYFEINKKILSKTLTNKEEIIKLIKEITNK